MLPQGLYSPHRTYRLELVLLNWAKRIKKLIRDFDILLLFVIEFLYVTYHNGNSFAVAPSQTREQTICINEQDKKVFSAFLNNGEL